MENGSVLGTWLAYAAIILFLLFLLALVLRTMALFATLTIMPISRRRALAPAALRTRWRLTTRDAP